MPTIFTHPAVPLALGLGLGCRWIPPRLLCAGVLASVLPDLDVLAFRFNVSYAHILGHRGFSHSLLFALMLALMATVLVTRRGDLRRICFVFVFLAALSHALLDMVTNGGLGVAVGWPFSSARFFAPWQFIEVAPLKVSRLFGAAGLTVLKSEVLGVWLPAMLLGIALWAFRKWRLASSAEADGLSAASRQ